jgi:regulator of RNase E activity RraA
MYALLLQSSFQVHARHHSTLGQNTFVRPSRLNIPLSIRHLPPLFETPFPNVDVTPGDILICDIDGCVAIPGRALEDVIHLAKKMKDIDEHVRRDLLAGKGVQETMKKWRN